jgi:hypothetical protein
VLLTFLAACGGNVAVDPSDSFLVPTSFELPSEGVRNHNAPIGPFCCTGTTATVGTTEGYAAGYAYFFTVKGQAWQVTPDTSYAPDVGILIAGLADVHNPQSPLVKGEIDFQASDLQVGAARSATVGQLTYTVTIEHVDLMPVEGVLSFDMQTLAVRLYVADQP